MACCYIAASMIGFLVHSCEALDLNIGIQYNDASRIAYEENESFSGRKYDHNLERGVTVVSIDGMTCAACTSTVERALQNIKGVRRSLVSLALREARVFHDTEVDRQTIVCTIEDAGYAAKIGERDPATKADALANADELARLRRCLRGLTYYSTCIFGLGKGAEMLGVSDCLNDLSFHLLVGRNFVLLSLAAVAAVQHGQWIYQSAWSAAVKGRVNMYTLISVSVGLSLMLAVTQLMQAGAPIGDSLYFDSVVGVLLIVAAGRYVELLSRRRATQTFAGLYTLLDQTSSAHLAGADRELVPTSVVRAGDEIVISAYGIVPCDSYVVSGHSHVNEALVTGEALPKVKTEGDLLLAGCRNGPGELRARVTQQNGGTSFLAQLVRSVEDSLGAKVSIQKRIDTITQHFVSAVFAIAIVVGAYAYSTTAPVNDPYRIASRKVITILAAACPCALGLATPCAIMAGVDVAWRCGVLVLRGGETLEAVTSITHVVMDKTGTLTRGCFHVSEIAFAPEWRENDRKIELAVVCCAAEEQAMTSHPLALAVFRHLLTVAGEQWARYQADGGAVENLIEVPGGGVQCVVCWPGHGVKQIIVGSLEFLRGKNIKGIELLQRPPSSPEGSTVFLGIDGAAAASICLQDIPRPDAESTIQALKARGLHVSMLTGDNAFEAARLSQELSIPVLDAHATPTVKLNHIKKLQESNSKILMIGDGMNDGPALAASEVGVMIAHGNKCFSSGGDVLLLQSELSSLLTLFEIASSTMSQISTSIWWALSYNILAVGLAAGLGDPFGLSISPTMAAMMMSGSSLFVTAQGLLLRNRLSARHCKDER